MKILVAQDEAFNFTYRANIDWLRKHGEVQFFSPLHDKVPLPLQEGHVGVWLYLPGGYPELFAQQLTANVAMRCVIKEFAERGGRIFAECGGFMYLCTAIDDAEMCGVLPIRATMEGARLHLGYRQMEWGGKQIKGHEFHYSSIQDSDATLSTEEGGIVASLSIEEGGIVASLPTRVIRAQCNAAGKTVDTPIYRYKNVVAGYTHWYWADKEMDDFEDFWKL